jgi:trypsin
MYRKSIIRIINGQSAPDQRFSYSQVSLALKNEHQCGGSVIAPDFILSAAHCRYWFDSISIDRYDLTQPRNPQEMFQAINITIHPNFDADTFRNDFMLIQLNGTTNTNPVRMNNNSLVPFDGMELTVLGWGTTNNSNPMNLIFPSILQMGSINYITNDQCMSTSLHDTSPYDGEIFPEMMCGTSANGVDACAGDSGGPLIVEGRSTASDLLVGLVSWGRGCTILPGVYSRISAEYQWLREQICFMSIEPPSYLSCTDAERNPKYALLQSTFSPTMAISTLPTAMTSHRDFINETSTVQIEIQLDTKSNETSWAIYSIEGVKVVDRPQGTYSNVTSTLVVEDIMLSSDQSYIFVILDSKGDGICCSPVDHGWFRISLKHIILDGTSNNTTLVHLIDGSGDFGRSSRFIFQTVLPVNVPSLAPTDTLREPTMLPSLQETNSRVDNLLYDSNGSATEKNLVSDSIAMNDNINKMSDQSSTFIQVHRSFSSTKLWFVWMIVTYTISVLDY